MRRGLQFIDAPSPDALPEDDDALLAWLGGPTAIRVSGSDPSRTRVVTTLLHGNEPSGMRAIRSWLRAGRRPAVSALLIIASVEAGRAKRRALPDRRDLNRCFGGPFDQDDEGRLAREILDAIAAARAEAVVDIHNNTGHNPAYGVATRAGERELALASRFGDRFVLAQLDLGALVEVVDVQPTITIECGRAGDPSADAIALRGLERFLEDASLAPQPGQAEGVEVLLDPVRVKLRAGVKLAVADAPERGADFTLRDDVDRHNFAEMPPGETLGWLAHDADWPIEVPDGRGADRSRALFERAGDRLVPREPIVPIMMTTDVEIATSDCLFYVVHRKHGAGS